MQTSEHVGRVPSSSGTWETSPAGANPTAKSVGRGEGPGWADWLLLIPDYDGCPYALGSFAEAVRWVGSRLGPDLERGLLLGLGGKLRGEARRCYRHKLQRFSGLEAFLRALYWHFSGVGAEGRLLERLRRVRQRDAEPLPEYAVRLDRLATQLCTIYAGEPRGELGLLQASALASFRRGLGSLELELRLGGCGPASLDEALPLAIALDRQTRRGGSCVAA